MTLVLIRHGESNANADGVLSGWQDVTLTEKGRKQATDVGHKITHYKQPSFFSSDLSRAIETARIAISIWSKSQSQTPKLKCLPELKERNMGDLQGIKKSILRKEGRMQVLQTWSDAPPGGESFKTLARRVFPILDQLPRQSIVFSHGGVIRMIVGLRSNQSKEEWMRLDVPNATPISVEVPKEGWAEWYKGIEPKIKD